MQVGRQVVQLCRGDCSACEAVALQLCVIVRRAIKLFDLPLSYGTCVGFKCKSYYSVVLVNLKWDNLLVPFSVEWDACPYK